jgi:hypothetical protein
MVHVFPSNVAILHAAKVALDQAGEFLKQRFLSGTAVADQ